MPFEDEPFNGDIFAEQEFIKIKNKFNVKNVIETGSCLFSTTKWFSENFESVYTFEIKKKFYKYGKEKVSGKINVKAYLSDSVIGLRNIINEISGASIFFLDAHWEAHCPLLDELDVISGYKIKPIIVIHDFKTDNPEFGYDRWNGNVFDLNFIRDKLRKIYPDGFEYHYNTEAAGAKRGFIYIFPK